MHQISAENLNAVRVIVNGEIITEFDIQTRAYEAFRIAAQKYSEAGLESKKQEIIENAIDELIDRKILVQEAKKLLVETPELSEQIEKSVDTFGGRAVCVGSWSNCSMRLSSDVGRGDKGDTANKPGCTR